MAPSCLFCQLLWFAVSETLDTSVCCIVKEDQGLGLGCSRDNILAAVFP